MLSLILGSLVDFLKTPEGCAIPINTLIDMAAQVGCTRPYSFCFLVSIALKTSGSNICTSQETNCPISVRITAQIYITDPCIFCLSLIPLFDLSLWRQHYLATALIPNLLVNNEHDCVCWNESRHLNTTTSATQAKLPKLDEHAI